ncbi:tRNA epoxyqueuosine(34) reductase QueG [Acetobacteraceae bacterium ESL0709]|nr:tRNA epoxyqueuosine(34) reductase QueG [Acetobacteraceae bacterium ESL0697]MDF7678752.1 tRNA epoxyqueuosine(34) reductase QueG [Acetobacteraceae bacterium ESL0709]
MSVLSHKPYTLEEKIEAQAYDIGFDAIGFCEANLDPSIEAGLRAFVARNYHGTMTWMEERIEQRAQPKALWPAVRSVISLGLSYAPGNDALAGLQQKTCGNISVYARNRDYHDVMKGMLKQLAQSVVKWGGNSTEVKVFVDTAPVAERDLAEKARLGWRGKHGCLVSRNHGSWLFLGEIYTNLSLAPSSPKGGKCGSCTRCLDSCPTDAFLEPGKMDARRCISYLTIEYKGSIPLELRSRIGNRIYGCDDCIAVCPWNNFAQTARTLKFHARDENSAPSLAELVQLDDTTFRQRFSGSPIKRIGRDSFIRNVLIAIGNSGDKTLYPYVIPVMKEENPVLAETALWAARRLEVQKTSS